MKEIDKNLADAVALKILDIMKKTGQGNLDWMQYLLAQKQL